jgi:hypothetical protein
MTHEELSKKYIEALEQIVELQREVIKLKNIPMFPGTPPEFTITSLCSKCGMGLITPDNFMLTCMPPIRCYKLTELGEQRLKIKRMKHD